MKHLKLFEDHKEKLYQEITMPNYRAPRSKRVKLTQSIINQISKILNIENIRVSYSIFSAGDLFSGNRLEFFQIEDEYFLACVWLKGGLPYTYECDGIDGLEQLIIDEDL